MPRRWIQLDRSREKKERNSIKELNEMADLESEAGQKGHGG